MHSVSYSVQSGIVILCLWVFVCLYAEFSRPPVLFFSKNLTISDSFEGISTSIIYKCCFSLHMCVSYTYINKMTPFIFNWGHNRHLFVRTTYKMAKIRNPDSKSCNFKCPYKALFNSKIYNFILIAKHL